MSEATVIVTCPHCDAANRYPTGRPAELANCGKCKEDLFTGVPVELSATSFDRFVGRNELPVVVDFWATWCGPCQTMAPQFAQAAQQLRGRARLAKLDTEAAQAIAARFGIRSIPTMIRFENGQEVARQSGAMSAGQIVEWIGTS